MGVLYLIEFLYLPQPKAQKPVARTGVEQGQKQHLPSAAQSHEPAAYASADFGPHEISPTRVIKFLSARVHWGGPLEGTVLHAASEP